MSNDRLHSELMFVDVMTMSVAHDPSLWLGSVVSIVGSVWCTYFLHGCGHCGLKRQPKPMTYAQASSRDLTMDVGLERLRKVWPLSVG